MRELGVLGLAVGTVVLAGWALVEARLPLPPVPSVPAFVGGGPSEPINEAPAEPSTASAAVVAPSPPVAEVAPAAEPGLRDQAWKSVELGEWDKARQLALECLAAARHDSSCRSALVASFSRRGQWDELHPYLSECLQLDPSNPTCLAASTMYNLKKGQLEEARHDVEALTVTGDHSVDSYAAAAEYALATKDTAGACTNFRAACAAGQPYACGRERELCASPKP